MFCEHCKLYMCVHKNSFHHIIHDSWIFTILITQSKWVRLHVPIYNIWKWMWKCSRKPGFCLFCTQFLVFCNFFNCQWNHIVVVVVVIFIEFHLSWQACVLSKGIVSMVNYCLTYTLLDSNAMSIKCASIVYSVQVWIRWRIFMWISFLNCNDPGPLFCNRHMRMQHKNPNCWKWDMLFDS